ncbi:RagB/SusD family nutrient uptake outer membrane protein [Robertkochia solimangrovi]|uniref:RagB/SusD family nutrient uptake outer membrane protein n=1 Tax=Robertkochia solimangrovi TaxID=2213046 RepID=UPI00117FCFA2|nr:RagB/SusD family nutrient uptake outer membrane protein [Robertkochia solimangrovi]TRZ41976.1 RagB/SusD family nutrient uptake outer membrane protein [Robertkochia solimangrovi]
MKSYLNKIFLLIFTGMALFQSCSIDDIRPQNQLTDENVIRDEESAQFALNGVYRQWRAYELGLFPLHLAASGNEGVFTGSVVGSSGMNTNEVTAENSFLANIYNQYYSIINEANILISKLESGAVEGIDEVRIKELVAQGKFNRALSYFGLLRNFGQFYDLNSSYGVVIRTEFSNDVYTANRNTVAEVYELIISDLQYAAESGPSNVAHYYGGSLAANALLAKVLMYVQRYDEAAELAFEVINNDQGYLLESTFEEVFTNTYNSSEVIFAPYTIVGSEGDVSMDQINRTNYSNILAAIADEQVDGSGDLSGNGKGYDPRFTYAYSEYTRGINNQGKYPFNTNAASGKGNTNYHLRLAELYLIYAESILRADNNYEAALWAINILRDRAGVSPIEFTTNEGLLAAVRSEKLLELFFENGESWFDLIRYHELGNTNAFEEKLSLKNEDQFILPLPLSALAGNNELIQNPGY